MDEVANPDVSATGEIAQQVTEINVQVEGQSQSAQEAFKPGADTAEKLGVKPPALDGTSPAQPSDSLTSGRSPDEQKVLTPDKQEEGVVERPAPPPRQTSKRPPLRRDGSAPVAPPGHPPPVAPAAPAQPAETTEFPQEPPDSLTLADLKRIRSGFANTQLPKQQILPLQQVYDFEYADAQSFPVEIEEWFSYSEAERTKLYKIRESYGEALRAFVIDKELSEDIDWTSKDFPECEFVAQFVQDLKTGTEYERKEALSVLCYLALGAWDETAGKGSEHPIEALFKNDAVPGVSRLENYQNSAMQLRWMVLAVRLLEQHGALPVVFDVLRYIFDRDVSDEEETREKTYHEGDESAELWCALTLLYLFLEVARTSSDDKFGQKLRQTISTLQPNLLVTLTEMIGRLRWDEAAPIPQTKMLLLAWKAILVCLGGIRDVEKAKASFEGEEEETDRRGQPVITASPLDYHLFRQEISSKYPAYQPPPPLFPLEPENNSILPPLQHRRSKFDIADNALTGVGSAGANGTSIMHQPVHIATPAPSPPPSPAGPGGKGGKKQNYQTNQMFPFLYPPLDASSNNLGGKGNTELQDALVGRKWEGTDIPTSILEAAELFAKRMRATRAMKQLWEVRVSFMKYERGWREDQNDGDIEPLELDKVDSIAQVEEPEAQPEVPQTDVEKKLAAVAEFYKDSLPHLQSVVIVLLKAVLKTVTDLVAATGGRNGSMQFQEPNGVPQVLENGNGLPDGSASTAEQVDNARSQEVTAKALSGIILLLLKWFKVSHILRYEYLTQLLLDSNYVPLIIRLWQGQEIGRACHFMLDREELNFFNFCHANSRNPKPTQPADGDESEDDAVPPPIRMRREEPDKEMSPTSMPEDYMHPPEIDELGYPQTPLPSSPLKNYSYRNIFTFINYLRILQKVTRRKTHRSLLLVSYKSSNHLKKSLRVPVEAMRYYTLKLFKSQVPYCGRKWRQGNMKIITAVWLSVPAELRDDWLQGGGGGMGGTGPGDVDGTVEEALPLEQSLRALTHWWNVKTYPDKMGVDKGLLDEEQDFFAKELEKTDRARGDEEGVIEEALPEEVWQGAPLVPLEGY